jgi:N-glycosylase/DNA lyase
MINCLVTEEVHKKIIAYNDFLFQNSKFKKLLNDSKNQQKKKIKNLNEELEKDPIGLNEEIKPEEKEGNTQYKIK